MHTEEMLTHWFQRYRDVTGDGVSAAVLAAAHVRLESMGSTNPNNYTVKQAARHLGISANKVYELCDSGQLRRQKIGRSVRIAAADLEDFKRLSTLEAAGPNLRCLSR